jgi:hypothetical protein
MHILRGVKRLLLKAFAAKGSNTLNDVSVWMSPDLLGIREFRSQMQSHTGFVEFARL